MDPRRLRWCRRSGLAALLFVLGCSGDPSRDAAARLVAQPAAEARSEFRAICERFTESDDPYFGRAQIAEAEGYLLLPASDPMARLIVRARLGMEKLRVGEATEAVQLLAAAHTIAVDEDLDPAILQDVTRRLALARLRSGEQANCVALHGPASCIVPFTAAARHRDAAGSLAAIDRYREYLERQPGSATVRWLLNVAAMTVGRQAEAVPPAWRHDPARLRSEQEFGRFVDRAWSAGLRLVESSGGGVMDDFDGDGLLDVVASTIDPCSPLRIFSNVGDGTFTETTREAGLDAQLGGLNVVHSDYDNDGDLDLLVLRGGWMGENGRIRNSLLRNDGRGVFDDVTLAAGLDGAYPTQTAAFADYDNDGDLDLYVGNESSEDLYLGGEAEAQAFPSQLFVNNGDGTFDEVGVAAGVTNNRFAKGVAWGDYDNDGDPDLYVSNLGPNRLYRNNGDATFTDVAPQLGLTAPEGRSFATWFFDYDNDGWSDLFVADYGARMEQVAAYFLGAPPDGSGRPLLYRNRGDGTFEEIGRQLGFTAPTLPMGANHGDLDNDGWPDVWLGTGDPSYESLIPNLVYRNDEGRAFRNVTFSGGFGHLQKGHGVAFGDVDNDGDQDVFEQMGGAYPGDAYPSALYENPGHGHAWTALRLRGVASNRLGVGARIRVTVATPRGPRSIHVTVGSGGSFGGSSFLQEVGLGDAVSVEELRVTWPASGTVQVFERVPLGRMLEIREDSEDLTPVDRPRLSLGE